MICFAHGWRRYLRLNERVKAVSNLFFNLGGALLGATAVRLNDRLTIDLPSALWLVGSAFLTWIAYMALGQLQSETIV
jgi:hypothetical protein